MHMWMLRHGFTMRTPNIPLLCTRALQMGTFLSSYRVLVDGLLTALCQCDQSKRITPQHQRNLRWLFQHQLENLQQPA